MMTLVLMAYEFAEKRRGLTLDDVKRPEFQDWFARFERGLSHHGPRLAESTGTLMNEMVRRGPAEYDCLVLYENLAVDSMKAAQGRWGDLQIVYPVPNVWTDHPYYVLDVPWSSPEQREAADEFLRFLMSEPIQRQALAHGFRPGNLTVSPRSPESPLPKMEPAGVRLDVPSMAEAPRADVVSELLSAFHRVQP